MTLRNHQTNQSRLHIFFDKLRKIELPTALQRKVYKQYLTAIIMVLFLIFLSVYTKNTGYLPGLLIPAGLVYLGIRTTLDFDSGEIIELAVICTSVHTYLMRDTTHVIFRTEEETPRYFSFVIPGKKVSKSLIPNSGYIIYFQKNTPETLLGFSPI